MCEYKTASIHLVQLVTPCLAAGKQKKLIWSENYPNRGLGVDPKKKKVLKRSGFPPLLHIIQLISPNNYWSSRICGQLNSRLAKASRGEKMPSY